MEERYISLMNKSIKHLFLNALKISIKSPSMALYITKIIRYHKKAERLREGWEKQGVQVPPYMIASITKRCNLNCKGCYARAHHHSAGTEMSDVVLKKLIADAKELGILFIFLAGGEPLLRGEILDIAGSFPQIVFPIFTNGLLINDEMVLKLKKLRNVVPVISLEGYEDDTDSRRGKGVYEHAAEVMKKLGSNSIFYGTSLTVSKHNFDTVTSKEFVEKLIDLKCKLFFFVEYVPVRIGTEDWIPTEKQRKDMISLMNSLRMKFPGLFIAFPGDEEAYGGCMSAGRGFVHIGPDGSVEPCPFAPYSDSNLASTSLKDALQSDFLKAIRQNHDQLVETRGGCALWEKQEWVRSLLSKKP